MDRLDNIVSFTDSGKGKLYFTGGSYLGYNALGGYYDANMADWALQKDYIGKGAHIRIDFLPTGYMLVQQRVEIRLTDITTSLSG